MNAVKEQILIHCFGLGLEEAHHPWSKGGITFSSKQLLKHLTEKLIPMADELDILMELPLNSAAFMVHVCVTSVATVVLGVIVSVVVSGVVVVVGVSFRVALVVSVVSSIVAIIVCISSNSFCTSVVSLFTCMMAAHSTLVTASSLSSSSSLSCSSHGLSVISFMWSLVFRVHALSN